VSAVERCVGGRDHRKNVDPVFNKTRSKNFDKTSHQRREDGGERERRGGEAKTLRLQFRTEQVIQDDE